VVFVPRTHAKMEDMYPLTLFAAMVGSLNDRAHHLYNSFGDEIEQPDIGALGNFHRALLAVFRVEAALSIVGKPTVDT
jgi:hypothetical protein